MVSIQPTVKLCLLLISQSDGLRNLRNAVPYVLDKLYALRNAQVHYTCLRQCAHSLSTLAVTPVFINLFLRTSVVWLRAGRELATTTLLAHDQPIVLGVSADPDPQESSWIGHGKRTVVYPHTSRPQFAGLLEM